jgi:imidazolonepropionase
VRATREADEEDLFERGSRRLARLAREGVTTVEIKSGYGLDLDSELKMLRVARRLAEATDLDVVTTFLGAHALPPEYADRRASWVDRLCAEWVPAVAESGLADAVDAFLEEIAFDAQECAAFFEAAKAHRLPVRLHADQLSDGGGAALAARFGATSADHLEYASRQGVEAMAEAGTVAVLLPGAFYVLRESRVPPVEEFRRAGVPMALGTDLNPGSSPVSSLLLVINMAATLFRLTPEEALAGVTRNGALALGLGDDRGTIELGKRADLALWDVAHPAELAYWVGAAPPRLVMKDGVTRDPRSS